MKQIGRFGTSLLEYYSERPLSVVHKLDKSYKLYNYKSSLLNELVTSSIRHVYAVVSFCAEETVECYHDLTSTTVIKFILLLAFNRKNRIGCPPPGYVCVLLTSCLAICCCSRHTYANESENHERSAFSAPFETRNAIMLRAFFNFDAFRFALICKPTCKYFST